MFISTAYVECLHVKLVFRTSNLDNYYTYMILAFNSLTGLQLGVSYGILHHRLTRALKAPQRERRPLLLTTSVKVITGFSFPFVRQYKRIKGTQRLLSKHFTVTDRFHSIGNYNYIT